MLINPSPGGTGSTSAPLFIVISNANAFPLPVVQWPSDAKVNQWIYVHIATQMDVTSIFNGHNQEIMTVPTEL